MESMLSANLVILDESGELRTPPSQPYTDVEETTIKTVLMQQLRRMLDKGWPISATFEQFLDDWEQATEEENATEAGSDHEEGQDREEGEVEEAEAGTEVEVEAREA